MKRTGALSIIYHVRIMYIFSKIKHIILTTNGKHYYEPKAVHNYYFHRCYNNIIARDYLYDMIKKTKCRINVGIIMIRIVPVEFSAG